MYKTNLHIAVTCGVLLALVFSLHQHQQSGAQALQAPGAFNKILPLNQSAFLSVWTLTLDWDDSVGATQYEYCFDKTNDNSCDSSWTSTGINTSVVIGNLEADTTYYWQARALNAGGNTEADGGAWWAFTTGGYARFHVQVVENDISGYDWRPGIPVTVTVDDPFNGVGVDFTDTKIVETNGHVTFYNLNGLQLGTDTFVTMAGGAVFKSHTVISLQVTEVDAVADTVKGTGKAGVEIYANHCEFYGCLWRRWTTIKPDGTWQVDFSVPGPRPDESEILDIVPHTPGEMLYVDIDADHTDASWNKKQEVYTYPVEERVEGTGWIVGKTMTVNIDDPATPANPDFSQTTPVIVHPWDNRQTFFSLDFNGQYNLKPTDVATVTDGTITKVHTVTNLRVLSVNAITDSVSGTAAPSSYVDVRTCFVGGCAQRTELADSNGNWSANFGVVGDQPWEIILRDIQPGTGGDARQWDNDIGSTLVYWSGKHMMFLPVVMRH